MATKKDIMNIESMFMLAEVARSSGKRQASKEYNVSVDTLNKYIENLSIYMGFKMLNSNGRGSILTSRASEIVDKANHIKQIMNEIEAMRQTCKDISGEVVAGMPMMVSSNFTLVDLPAFLDQYPEIQIKSLSLLDNEVTEACISNYDIAIITELPTNSDLVVMASRKVEGGFFASPEYLSRYGYPVDVEDMIVNHRLVHKIGFEKIIPVWNEILKDAKHICYSSNSAYAVTEVIRNSGGIGVMPLRYKDEGLVCLDNIKCDTNITFYLVAHKDSKDIPKIRAVLNYYKDLLQVM